VSEAATQIAAVAAGSEAAAGTGTKAPRSRYDIGRLFAGTGGPELLEKRLLEEKLVPDKAIEAARMERGVSGDRLGSILVRNGLLSQKTLIEKILEVAPREIASERIARSRIPPDVLRLNSILLSAETENTIYVSTMGRERPVREIVERYYPDKEVRFVSFQPGLMSEFLVRMQTMAGGEDGEVDQDERLEYLVHQAHEMGASDIHIIPKGRTYSVFFRLLGERHLVHEGPMEEYQSVRAQVKNRAGMDVAETRLPQDGVFQVDFAGKLVDFRTVAVPVIFGEYIVLRLLDPDSVRLSLGAMGISRLAHWRRGFQQMNGLCLICGPTGSGKTTTLNATMRETDRFGKAIFTVEDPVEYPIVYAGQVSVNTAVGFDYTRALRAFMRSDPEIINVGEVRDEETARTMVRAAETGHMVLATLHASSIRGAISRLEYLNIPPHDLRYIVRAVLVQNLVRTLCLHCHGAGCPKCKQTGYGGRTIVSECQSFSSEEEFDRMVQGEVFWPRIVEDAADRLEEGVTDMRELVRIYGSAIEEEVERRRQKPLAGKTDMAGVDFAAGAGEAGSDSVAADVADVGDATDAVGASHRLPSSFPVDALETES